MTVLYMFEQNHSFSRSLAKLKLVAILGFFRQTTLKLVSFPDFIWHIYRFDLCWGRFWVWD